MPFALTPGVPLGDATAQGAAFWFFLYLVRRLDVDVGKKDIMCVAGRPSALRVNCAGKRRGMVCCAAGAFPTLRSIRC